MAGIQNHYFIRKVLLFLDDSIKVKTLTGESRVHLQLLLWLGREKPLPHTIIFLAKMFPEPVDMQKNVKLLSIKTLK
jgi:hypothetical protein